MPLLDHFRPPVSQARFWESFHAAWTVALMERLNGEVLPPGYFAQAQVHVGSRVEVDVATFQDEPEAAASANGATAILTAPSYAPPATALTLPLLFPDEIEVQVFADRTGPSLVGAIELVSPGNKDRPEARRAFTAKALNYLSQGVGLVIVDVVTERTANLHNELVRQLGLGAPYLFPDATNLYAAAYRPLRRAAEGDQADLWMAPLALGRALPTLPLGLRNAGCVPVDLEAAYADARTRSRL
jgi:hypothetical protein